MDKETHFCRRVSHRNLRRPIRYPWSHDHARKPAQRRITKRKSEIKKAQLVAQVARMVQKRGLDYDGWRYVAKKVRQVCDLRPEKKGRRLPRVLTTEEFRRFYQVVDRAEDVQHALMLRLLFFTAVRVSELCNIGISEVDLEACKIRINQGKGSKDRTCCSASPSPRLCERTSLPTRITAGSSRPRGMASSQHKTGPADRLQVCRGGGRQGDPAHVPAPSDHLADPALGLG